MYREQQFFNPFPTFPTLYFPFSHCLQMIQQHEHFGGCGNEGHRFLALGQQWVEEPWALVAALWCWLPLQELDACSLGISRMCRGVLQWVPR